MSLLALGLAALFGLISLLFAACFGVAAEAKEPLNERVLFFTAAFVFLAASITSAVLS